jgi:hypothetical protein
MVTADRPGDVTADRWRSAVALGFGIRDDLLDGVPPPTIPNSV